MVIHSLQTHPRDEWCLLFHLTVYLSFCDHAVIAVDSDPAYSRRIRTWFDRITVIDFDGSDGIPEHRTNHLGVFYREKEIRQASLDEAMKLNPDLIVFGDTDEVPTPDIADWIKTVCGLPRGDRRWYVHWVNLWGDFHHAIGGDSNWSFQSGRGNKKCLAMQPGTDLKYIGGQHCGMEPGRFGGGGAPVGPGRVLIDTPKLVHLKYGWEGYAARPEAKLTRHQPEVMLEGGRVVCVPESWLWPAMVVA